MTKTFRWLTVALALLAASHSGRAAGAPDTFSPVVSYQYQDSLADPSSQTSIYSPVVSYQYFDWPGDENLTFQNSPAVSYYFNGMPAILVQPVSQVAQVGDPVSFSVQVQGSSPLSCQWYFNNNAIAGATNPTLTFSSAQLTQAASYNVVVSNQYGIASSNLVSLNIFLPPVIPKPPLPNFTVAGSTPPAILTASPLPKGSLVPLNGPMTAAKTTIIVLTHGWLGNLSNSDEWPNVMANLLINNGYGANAYIVAWDWHENANPNGNAVK